MGVEGRVSVNWGIVRSLAYGAAAAAIAVVVRASMPLPSTLLPFFTVIIAICVATVIAGIAGGISAMVFGAFLTWHFVLSPNSWMLSAEEMYSLLGYLAVGIVIIGTSELYRRSEQNRQEAAVSAARKDAEQQHMFASELSHRLKNALTIVQAIAGQTFPAEVPQKKTFEERLNALANAHKLLLDHVDQPSASIAALVGEAMKGFDGARSAEQIESEGEDFEVPGQQAIMLALALHELSTNAVKYGALCSPNGRVSIKWWREGSQLRLQWAERGGPAVVAPAHKGFGTRLLMRAGSSTDLRFDPEGVTCLIAAQL